MERTPQGKLLYSFTRLQDVRQGGARVIVRGEDCHVWDDEGKRYIDGFAGLQVVNIGHGRREVAEAVKRQLDELEFWHSFFGFTTAPTVKLAEKMASLAPGSLAVSHFVNSGSEGNDSAIKIARAYHRARGENRYKIVYRDRAYHGMNIGSTSINGLAANRNPYEPLLPGMVRIPQCHCYRCPFGVSYPGCALECALALERAIVEEGPESVAAFIADPVQGTIGGYVPPVPEYFPLVREICTRYGVLFICDEVITGFGRTGKMFGIEHYPGAQPDVMVTAKGLSSGYIPLGAVTVTEEVASVLEQGIFFHGYTYGGHPVATACALANIEIIEKENLPQKAAVTGTHIAAGLRRFLDHPAVGEVRAQGMMFALELVKNKETRENQPVEFATTVMNRAFAKGLIMRMSTAGRSLLLCPPLTMTPALGDEMLSILEEALGKVEKEFGTA